MPKTFIVMLMVLGCAAVALCQTAPNVPIIPVPKPPLPAMAPGRYREHLWVSRLRREYLMQVPAAYDGFHRLPLVILLHGWSGDAETISANTGFRRKAQKEGFVLVSPEGLGRPQGWNVGFMDLTGNRRPEDVKFIEQLIDRVEAEVGIDDRRVYVAGHSNGAMLAHLIGSKLGDRVAAIAAVSGTIGVPSGDGRSMNQIPSPASPISVLIMHGRIDGMVAYDRHSNALITGVSAPNSARWWALNDNCKLTPTVVIRGNIETDLYTNGTNGVEVELVSIRNGSHDWPGGLSTSGRETDSGIHATDMIWNFFQSHPKS